MRSSGWYTNNMSAKSAQNHDDELDPNIIRLVQALNAYHGVKTNGSCGGHPNPVMGQWSEGRYYVKMRITQNRLGWLVLEFLAWAINNDFNGAVLKLSAPPPYLNKPGQVLHFVVEGAAKVAALMT